MALADELAEGIALIEKEKAENPYGQRGTWHPICVCGHTKKFHSTDIGGDAPASEEKVGVKVKTTYLTKGCGGPPRSRGSAPYTPEAGGTPTDRRLQRPITCPCHEFRPVAEALTPRLRFCQKLPVYPGTRDRNREYVRHPFFMGLVATQTSVSNLKAVTVPELTDRQRADLIGNLVNDRFRWIEGARKCWFPSCDATGDGVWPVFVDEADTSELRCPDHRES